MLSFGVRPPYSRWSDALLGFLRDVAEPYLRVFRRLLPAMGGFDFTPMIAIIVLYVARTVVRQCHRRLRRARSRSRRASG